MSGSGCGESYVAANKLINSVGSTVHVTRGPCQSLIQSKEHSYSDMDRDCEQTLITGATLNGSLSFSSYPYLPLLKVQRRLFFCAFLVDCGTTSAFGSSQSEGNDQGISENQVGRSAFDSGRLWVFQCGRLAFSEQPAAGNCDVDNHCTGESDLSAIGKYRQPPLDLSARVIECTTAPFFSDRCF
eukprot:SAG11_NODE_162_length_13962_cov_19.035562_13_plen_185_part_00